MSRFPLSDQWRVAQIVTGSNGPARVGSGYLVSTGVLLTARHVVDGRRTGDCVVRFPYRRSVVRHVSEVVPGPADADLAVVLLTDPALTVNPTRFGRLTRATEDPIAIAMGYPRWRNRTGTEKPYRDLAPVRGRLNLLTLYTRAGLEFGLEQPLPEQAEHAAWGGMSGGPVWVDGRLVGIVIENHRDEGMGRLVVEPVQRIYQGVTSGMRARAVDLLGLPRSVQDLMPIGDGDGDERDGEDDSNGFVRFVLESTFLAAISLTDGRRYRIGSSPTNAVVVTRDGVSTRHCVLSVTAGAQQIRRRVSIKDLDSDDGTFVNGEELMPYEECWLNDGDEVSLGKATSFRLRSLY